MHDHLGHRGISQLGLYGQDIDIRCVTMCRIQLRLNGLDACGRMARLIGNQRLIDVNPRQAFLPRLAA